MRDEKFLIAQGRTRERRESAGRAGRRSRNRPASRRKTGRSSRKAVSGESRRGSDEKYMRRFLYRFEESQAGRPRIFNAP